MPFEIAKNAIDYFNKLTNSEHRISRYGRKTIGFYGGEPLLNFDLIEKCIHYARSLNFRDSLNFNITTNGSLLDDKKIYFLIKNNFNVLISLDGPKKEHDKFRINQGGKGTFNVVWRNIKRIYEISKEYFINNVGFNAIYCEFHELFKISEFFQDKYFKENIIRVGKASGLGKEFYLMIEKDFFDMNYYQNFKLQYNRLRNIFIESMIMGKRPSRYICSLFLQYFESFIKKKYIDYKDRLRALREGQIGTCFPGSIRLYVTTDGNFHMCERVDKHFSIGDYRKGIEYNKVIDILNYYYKEVYVHCIFCEAMNICQSCIATFANNGVLNNRKYCEKIKNSLLQLLIDYVSIMEKNPMAFHELR